MARLSRVITARLTPDEFEAVQQRAATLGVTTSALLREALVVPSLINKTIENVPRREFRAFRAILINLLYQIGTHATITEEYVKQLILKADREA